VWIEGRPAPPPGEFNLTVFVTVSERYFETTGTQAPARPERSLATDNLRSPDVVVINEAFARQYYPGQDPIGNRIAYGLPNNEHYCAPIVGLAADTYEGLGQPARATTYAPFRQALDPFTSGAFLVKTSIPRPPSVRPCGRPCSHPIRISRFRASVPVEDDMRASIATQRFTMLIATLFAGLALMLAGDWHVWRDEPRREEPHEGNRRAHGARRDTAQYRQARIG
jgi:putative ABC transport system permease protein